MFTITTKRLYTSTCQHAWSDLKYKNTNRKVKLVTVDVSAARASLPKAETVSFTEGVDVYRERDRYLTFWTQNKIKVSCAGLCSSPFSRVPPENLTGSWGSRPPGPNHWSWPRWRWERPRCPPRPPRLLGTVCSASGRRTWNESRGGRCSRPPSTAGWNRNNEGTL